MNTHLSTPKREPAKAAPVHAPSSELQEIVALIPGFMGFDHLGGLSYFTDGVLAAVRAAREATVEGCVPVIGLTTLPASSLVRRQECLFEQLQQQIQRHRPKRIHLIGHSTGGVDAYFATCKRRLDGSPWTKAEHEVRSKLGSITTLSSPLLGTTLVGSSVAQFIARPLGQVAPARQLAAAGLGVGLLLAENPGTPARLAELLEGLPSAFELVRQLLRHRELIDDLSPQRMLARCQDNQPDLDIQRTYFATCVQLATTDACFLLFRQMYEATAEQAVGAPPEHLAHNLRLLAAAPVISSHGHPPIALDGASSDGMCNTLRQLPPDACPAEVGALILGDHLDVMGYFDRIDPATGRERHTSIFRSGAGFREDQFFELFGTIATRLG